MSRIKYFPPNLKRSSLNHYQWVREFGFNKYRKVMSGILILKPENELELSPLNEHIRTKILVAKAIA